MDPVLDFSRIVEEYEGRIFRYLTGFVGDAALAQDLTQETLLRVHKASEQLRDLGARSAWIYKIASNLALDHLRRRRGADAQWHVIAENEEFGGDAYGAAIPSEELSVEERLEQQEMAECLRLQVSELPETLRDCLVLRDVEGLGEKPAAEILGCSVGAVKVRTHRARKKLREQLDQGCHFYKDGRGRLQCPGCHFYEDSHGALQCGPAEAAGNGEPAGVGGRGRDPMGTSAEPSTGPSTPECCGKRR